MDAPDLQLLARYANFGDDTAFAEVVRRHLDLVHSVALRHVRSPPLAEEVSQSVFTDLARSACRLAPGTVLPAWLWSVTRRTAIDAARREARRRLREHAAYELTAMNAPTADWIALEPLLDEAMHALDDTDRAVVLLRWFENKSLGEIAAVLGTSEDAAQKRASRALDRLRKFFAQRGIIASADGMAAVISSNAVSAAPTGLAAVVMDNVLSVGVSAPLFPTFLAMTNSAKVTLAIALIITAAAILYYSPFQSAPNPSRPVVAATVAPAVLDQLSDIAAATQPDPTVNAVDPALLQAALNTLIAQQQSSAAPTIGGPGFETVWIPVSQSMIDQMRLQAAPAAMPGQVSDDAEVIQLFLKKSGVDFPSGSKITLNGSVIIATQLSANIEIIRAIVATLNDGNGGKASAGPAP